MTVSAVIRPGQLEENFREDNHHDNHAHLHLLHLLFGGQLLLLVGGLGGKDIVQLGADSRHCQSPAEVEIAENFLLQLQLGLGVLPCHVDGQVEADVVRVRKKRDLGTGESKDLFWNETCANLVPPSDHHHVDVESHQKGNHRGKIIEIRLELFCSLSFYEILGPVSASRSRFINPIDNITSGVLIQHRQDVVDDQVNDGVHQVEDMKKSQLFPFIKVCTMIYCIVIRLKPPHILRMRTVQKFLAPVPR